MHNPSVSASLPMTYFIYKARGYSGEVYVLVIANVIILNLIYVLAAVDWVESSEKLVLIITYNSIARMLTFVVSEFLNYLTFLKT